MVDGLIFYPSDYMETGEPDIYCAVMAEEHRQQTSSNLGLIFIKGCLTNYNSVSQSENIDLYPNIYFTEKQTYKKQNKKNKQNMMKTGS